MATIPARSGMQQQQDLSLGGMLFERKVGGNERMREYEGGAAFLYGSKARCVDPDIVPHVSFVCPLSSQSNNKVHQPSVEQ